jgi:hypothetical protein
MEISRARVVATMERVGLMAEAAEAESQLPDPVELPRDGELLAKFGVSYDWLVERMGGGP